MMDVSALVPLPVPVPPMLEAALGYSGSARLVAFYWTPLGDEAAYDDGVASGDGDWAAYLSFIQHPTVAPHLGAFDLGSSEREARQWLVLDREARTLSAVPAREAAALLHQQWATRPDAPPVVESLEEIQAALEAFTDVTGWQEVPVDMAAVERGMREQEARLEALLAWLDQQEEGKQR